MSFSTIKEYYETLKDSYVLACKGEKSIDFKSKIGHRFDSLLIILFILTFSQIIPLSILNLLPKAYKLIPFYKIDIPTIIPINIVILLILKLLHYLNNEHLVYAFLHDRKGRERIGPLQKAFSAIFTCLIKLKAYCETNDEVQVKEAIEHYFTFQEMIPYQLLFEDEDRQLHNINEILSKNYRHNYLPWFKFTGVQLDDIETVKYFMIQLKNRLINRKGISDIIPSLEAFSVVYYSSLKDKDAINQNFLEFKQRAKTIPIFEPAPKSPQVKIKEKVEAFYVKVQKNSLLYFALAFFTYLVIAFIFVYWPCRAFFDVSPKMLAPVVFATAITLACMDTNKNVKTDLNQKEEKKK